MKIAGWICAILGGLSFLGGLLNGSVLGPCFFLGLGIFLLHKANQNKQEEQEKDGWAQKQNNK